MTRPKVQPTLSKDPRNPRVFEDAISATYEYAAGTAMADTAEHKALPTKTIVASVAKVIKSQPMVIGMVMNIMVRRLPITEHNGDDIGALNIATRGTIEPK